MRENSVSLVGQRDGKQPSGEVQSIEDVKSAVYEVI